MLRIVDMVVFDCEGRNPLASKRRGESAFLTRTYAVVLRPPECRRRAIGRVQMAWPSGGRS